MLLLQAKESLMNRGWSQRVGFRVFSWIVLVVSTSLGSGAFAGQVPHKITPGLAELLENASSEQLIPVSIVLTDQMTGDRLRQQVAGVRDSRERRRLVTRALKQHAANSQRHLRELFEPLQAVGRARRLTYLWIGNVIGGELRPEEIRRIAQASEVQRINWDPPRDIRLSQSLAPTSNASGFGEHAGSVPWERSSRGLPALQTAESGVDEVVCGVQKIQAPRVWNELGITGTGVVVALLDDGLCWTHPDIAQQIWVNPGEDRNGNGVVMDAADVNGIDDDGNGFIDDLIGWDMVGNDRTPADDGGAGHGAHCGGIVAGDGTSGSQAGVAHNAKLMIVRAISADGTEMDVWTSMQYAADNGADVASMSIGFLPVTNPDRAQWRVVTDNLIDAGTIVVIGAGNEGAGAEPFNLRTPGDVPRAITVGATDCADNIAGFSSRGPTTWADVIEYQDYPYPPGLIKPDVVAPGDNIKSHNACAGYRLESGTSMATPHVAGTVALMKSANPGLTHDEVKEILQATAVDLGTAGKDNVFGAGRVDAYQAVLAGGTRDGKIDIVESAGNCTATLRIVLSDSDLGGSGTRSVNVSSDQEPAGESIVLSETGPSSGKFQGVVSLAVGPAVADGKVQVANGSTVTAKYVDADDGHGGLGVLNTDTALVDCIVPRIDFVRATDLGLNSATIRWTSTEPTTSSVDYGSSKPPALSADLVPLVPNHQVKLTGLSSCTTYYYWVEGTDRARNGVRDDNAGRFYRFETYADFGLGPQPCHAGRVLFESPSLACTSTARFNLTDPDLNRNSSQIETAVLYLSSSSETQPEAVTVTESAANSSRFDGTILLTTGLPVADGRLQVQDEDLITATYFDADDGTGTSLASSATVRADCSGPKLTNLRVETITDQRATIQFSTSEPGDAVVEWGTTPVLGNTTTVPGLRSSHAVTINKFNQCQNIFFRVRSTDAPGNQRLLDRNGVPFSFQTWLIPGLYWRDSFDGTPTGWTLQGEWEIDAPRGLGVGSGFPDPPNAYNNTKVLGTDLIGRGANSGSYENNLSSQRARTPTFNATTWRNTKLIYYVKLNVVAGDTAELWTFNPIGFPLTSSAGNELFYQDWRVESANVAGTADGRSQFWLEYRISSDASGVASGWNIDDVILKDGSKPDYGSCGGCTAAPSFRGALAAQDNNACGGGGNTVSWESATAWGSGGTGTYSVHRGASPGFVPTASNRIATGVSGLTYSDATAPAGISYYLVRAENNETCSTGPANGGVVDDNASYVGTDNSSSQPVPGEASGLMLTVVNEAHVRLSWIAAPQATLHRVYRSMIPQLSGFAARSDVTATRFDDAGAASSAHNYFYLVKGVNSCEQEGP